MRQYSILRETPEHSGNFILTGEVLEGSAEEAADRCVTLAATGGRFGFHVYESLRSPAAPEPQQPASPPDAHAEPPAEEYVEPPAEEHVDPAEPGAEPAHTA